MTPLFVGGHPALDFLNTVLTRQGTPIETISDGQAFVAWLASAGMLDDPAAAKVSRRFGAKALDAAAAEARSCRQWAGGWIARWVEEPGANFEADLFRLNGLLRSTRCYREILAAKGGLQLKERNRLKSTDELLALVAAQIALLVANEQPALVKRCAGPGCTLWFVDRTKAHGRLFCSASACGNRAKVAAFRDRRRAK